ncbi:DegT/DnrJ/EryC1/StrS family aminotransferase [Noviherbaspirillum galbum]|uniref:DegT/DnrJ/EryC1/StrS family aminotransferase n=1 Tax=Noviherbaspirillum galbum TaxID=2709383 RepID=A0A6B3STN5_9BURK|nr:DegT/DnrJ/EryC1/StrS family aminotransferase [Noviherbaspirillum galbum]NEX64044.1 DegT/DnrJ/EryC1/StrS family aminotransferase [Noviherbaspirillum galbum]
MEFTDLKMQYRLMKAEIDRRIHAVLDHGAYILGPEVEELEGRLAAYTGARHCITVASGTEALLISLMAAGIRAGDEVITTPFSFIATAEVIVLLGAKPVYADVEIDTCNIDVSRIEAKVTSKTRAIIPVSLYGQPSDMDEINAIAERHGLVVIEDAAQSFGASYKGRRSCNLSHVGCTSFFPSKPLGCYGDGGAIFTSDDALAAAMREIRVHGQSRRYVHTRVGVGGRMDTLQCAIVLAKLEHFEWEVEQRVRIGARYGALFKGHIETVAVRPDRSSVHAQYTIMVEQRDKVALALANLQIPTAVHYPTPIPLQPAYADGYLPEDFPVSSRLSRRVLSLPMGPYMYDDTVSRIVDAVVASL